MPSSAVSDHKKIQKFLPIFWFVFLVYIALTVHYLPANFDEAKYLSVINQVSHGSIPGINVNPGSGGEAYYFLNYLWSFIFSVGYINFRIFDAILTIISVVILYKGVTQLAKSTAAKFAFACFVLLNPALVSFGVEINPMAISMACIMTALGLVCMLYADGTRKKHLYCIFFIGVLASLSILTKIYCVLFFPVYALALFSWLRRNNNLAVPLALLMVGFIVPIILVVVLFGMSITQAIVTLRIEALFEHLNSLMPFLKLKTPPRPHFVAGHYSYPQPLNVIHMSSPSEIFSPLVRQFFGYSGNAINILVLFFVSYTVFNFKSIGYNRSKLVFNLLGVGVFVLLSMLVFRYAYHSAYSYIYYVMPLLWIASIIGIDFFSTMKRGRDYDINTFIMILVILSLQNLIFLIPARTVDNPTYTIYKQLVEGDRNKINQIRNIKQAANIANNFLTKNSIVYEPKQFLLPYLKGKSLHGTEMNYSKNFFNKYALKAKPLQNDMGTGAAYVAQQIRLAKFSLIVLERGRNEAVIKRFLSKSYCFKKQFLEYKMYLPCKKAI